MTYRFTFVSLVPLHPNPSPLTCRTVSSPYCSPKLVDQEFSQGQSLGYYLKEKFS